MNLSLVSVTVAPWFAISWVPAGIVIGLIEQYALSLSHRWETGERRHINWFTPEAWIFMALMGWIMFPRLFFAPPVLFFSWREGKRRVEFEGWRANRKLRGAQS